MKWLTNNAGLKAISLVLATGIWFFVSSVTSDTNVIHGVPLKININSEMAILQQSASTINVTVRGTRDDVQKVSPQDLSAVVDLTGQERTGEIVVPLLPRIIHHSRRIQVTEIDPPEATVEVDRMVERDLAVHPRLIGEPPSGVVVEQVVTTPEVVKLRAPETVINKLDHIDTLPVDLTNRRTSFRERVELTPLSFASGGSQRQWVEVDVRIGAGPVDSGANQGVKTRP